MFSQLWNQFNSFEFGKPDPLTAQLPLVGTPFQVFLINFAYLLFIYKLGPALMRNRPPYQLKTILLVYNAFQVLLNTCIPICAYLMIIQYREYDLRCMAALPDENPRKHIETACFSLYYIVKFVDYFDTIFFVLRKSWRQITFLHVYHHIIMATFGYYYMRYIGVGGHIASMGILNSIVHVFMYGYYFVSALRPDMKNSIWWKKYITKMQLVQFVLVLLHNLYPLLFMPNCKSSKFMLYMAISQSAVMLLLFGNFYWKTYMRNIKIMKKEPLKSG